MKGHTFEYRVSFVPHCLEATKRRAWLSDSAANYLFVNLVYRRHSLVRIDFALGHPIHSWSESRKIATRNHKQRLEDSAMPAGQARIFYAAVITYLQEKTHSQLYTCP